MYPVERYQELTLGNPNHQQHVIFMQKRASEKMGLGGFHAFKFR